MVKGCIGLSGIAAGDGIASVGALVVPSWRGGCVGAADGGDVTGGLVSNGPGSRSVLIPMNRSKEGLLFYLEMPLEIFVPYINSNAFKSILLNEVVVSDPE